MLAFPFVVACLVSEPTDCRVLTVGAPFRPPFVVTRPLDADSCEEALEGFSNFISENMPVVILDSGCVAVNIGEPA